MSGSDISELNEGNAQIESLIGELKTAFEQVVVHGDDGDAIPPSYICMSICDDLRDIGPAAESAIPQVLELLNLRATNDDEHLLHLRAAHAHFAITGEAEICLNVAMRHLDLVSRERFSEGSPYGYDELFWIRAWACDILGEIGAKAFAAVERLNRLGEEDGCSKVRKSALQAIDRIKKSEPSIGT